MFCRSGVPLIPADNSRVLGWSRLREALAPLADGSPGLVFFPNCQNLIRTLPLLTYDTKNCEDVGDNLEDHAPEALRYGVMSRPGRGREPGLRKPASYDPFSSPREPREGFRGL